MHPLHGALPGPYVPERVTRDALIAHRYTYASPCLQDLAVPLDFYFPLRVPLERYYPIFDGVGLAGFKSRANAFLLP